MAYDVDYDYEYEVNEAGLSIIPEGTTHDGELYVLPNGRYMPSGVYFDPKSGLDVIYEPLELKPFKEILENLPTARLRDAIYGLAVSDALGVPYEFKPRGTFTCEGMVGHGTHNQPAGTWSDDTSMTLATCDSIRELGRDDTGDIRHRFERWLRGGEYTPDGVVFDCGITVSSAINAGRGLAGESDNGNGSLMRIAPLAFTDATDDEVRAVSAITHAHDMSCSLCVDYVHILRELAGGAPASDVAGEWRDRPAPGSSGFVRHTYDAALWCLANTGSYRDCVLAAVNLGDDTDTTAAVAGALAGTLYGYDAIPAEVARHPARQGPHRRLPVLIYLSGRRNPHGPRQRRHRPLARAPLPHHGRRLGKFHCHAQCAAAGCCGGVWAVFGEAIITTAAATSSGLA